MNIYDAINTRRTVRDFEDKAIEHQIIEKIISSGLKAPSNDHMRNWEFIVIQDKNIRAAILKNIPDTIPTAENDVNNWLDSWESKNKQQRDMYLKAMPRQYSMLYNSGCLIIPLFRQEDPLLEPKTLSSLNEFASIWCCIENILLAATAEGIAGVTRIPIENEAKHLKSIINHPDDYIMPCYIGLGYPAENVSQIIQNNIDTKERIHLNKW